MSAATVLVVEDRENWRSTFSELLADLEYQVLQADCGDEFQRQATAADVIVLDISMPIKRGEMEVRTAGLEVLLALQNEHPHHTAIQNPIVRSMWERSEFQNTRFDAVTVAPDHWVGRSEPIASILSRIEEVVQRKRGNP